MQGVSLAPLLKDEPWAPRDAYSEIYLVRNSSRSLIKNGLHLIWVKSGEAEKTMLFDMEKDPNELKDISAEQSILTRELSAQLYEIYADAKESSKQAKKWRLTKTLRIILKRWAICSRGGVQKDYFAFSSDIIPAPRRLY